MPTTRVGETYTEKDRAADFYAVFGTESGQRVLSQIFQICDPVSLPADADRPGVLAFKAGKRRVFNEIQRCFVVRNSSPFPEEYKDGEDGNAG